MATADDFKARLDSASNELASDLADLRSQLADAAARGEAVNQEWASKLDGPISRLEAMGSDDENPDPQGDAPVEAPADPTVDPTV